MKRNLTAKELKSLIKTDIITLIAGIVVTLFMGAYTFVTTDTAFLTMEILLILGGLIGIICSIKGIIDRKAKLKTIENTVENEVA